MWLLEKVAVKMSILKIVILASEQKFMESAMALVSHHEEDDLQSTIELARSVATMIQTFAPIFSSAIRLPSVNPNVPATIIEGLPKIFSNQQDKFTLQNKWL